MHKQLYHPSDVENGILLCFKTINAYSVAGVNNNVSR